MKKRIWELDAFRGLCIIGVVIVHLIYDLVDLYGIIKWDYPAWFAFVKDWGGIVFLILSGICVTLGSHNLRRGLIVFVCGMLCTAVTYGMYRMGFGMSIIIYFGVLHCLGVCMLLWAVFKKLPTWALLVLGLVMAAAGLYLKNNVVVDFPWLIPMGLKMQGFQSSDYFPLLPNFGFFLLGAALGKTVYAFGESLLPNVRETNPILRFLRGCGAHSLWIYLLHQPVLSGVMYLILLL